MPYFAFLHIKLNCLINFRTTQIFHLLLAKPLFMQPWCGTMPHVTKTLVRIRTKIPFQCQTVLYSNSDIPGQSQPECSPLQDAWKIK